MSLVAPKKVRKNVAASPDKRAQTPGEPPDKVSAEDFNEMFITGIEHCDDNYEEDEELLDDTKYDHHHNHMKGNDKLAKGLVLPTELIPRPIISKEHQSSTQLEVAKVVCQMPGGLAMSPMESNKYFGAEGRYNFFERNQWLRRQISITNVKAGETTESLIFDNEEKKVNATENYSFAPRRQRLSANTDDADDSDDDYDLFGRSEVTEDDDEITIMPSLHKSSSSNTISSFLSPISRRSPKGPLPSIRSRGGSRGQIPPTFSPLGVGGRRVLSNSFSSPIPLPSMTPEEADPHECGDDEHSQLTMDDDSHIKFIDVGGVGSPMTAPMGRARPTSARTKYLAGCAREGLNPRSSLIVRKLYSKELCLKHQGMGDVMATVLADSLRDLPYVQSIDLMDNNLTDVGMTPILNSILAITNLLELNLSNNIIGKVSAQALAEYLGSPGCPLIRLILRNADVDDEECEKFVRSIKENKNLQELDLANNKLGQAENLNTVYPDLITGGEALADLLRSPTCPLTTLKLAWNMIRLDGAIDLVSSLSINTTITYLDLSYNALGNVGGETLGDAIIDNRTLRTLHVSHNSLDACACFTLCIGIIENMALTKLYMDSNPIGEQGAKALMVVPLCVGSRVKISATHCNISIRAANCWFNYSQPCGSYHLFLSRPFDRAVAFAILHTIATHQTYICTKSMYEPPLVKGKGSRAEVLELVQSVAFDKEEFMDEKQLLIVNGLRKLKTAASKPAMAEKLFRDMDLDGGGEIDRFEFHNLLHMIGLDMSNERVDEILRQFDVDGGGTITLDEFHVFLKQQLSHANLRLKDLLESPMMSLKATPKKRYIPPREGSLKIDVVDGFAKKEIFRAISTCDREYLLDAAKNSTDTVQMLGYAVQNSKIRLNEALNLFDTIYNETRNKVKAATMLLPYMADPLEARNFMSKVTNDDRVEIAQIKSMLGNLLRPIFGFPDGFYCLDMSNNFNRICVSRLLEVSKTLATQRGAESPIGHSVMGDTSQQGNWSCFRNEMLNQKPVTITPTLFMPMPVRGFVEFDFVSGTRPSGEDIFLSDRRFLRVLKNNCLIKTTQMKELETGLLKSKRATEQKWANVLAGKLSSIEARGQSRADIEAFYLSREEFYDTLDVRGDTFQADMKKEEVKVNYMIAPNNAVAEEVVEETTKKMKGKRKNTIVAVEPAVAVPPGEGATSFSLPLGPEVECFNYVYDPGEVSTLWDGPDKNCVISKLDTPEEVKEKEHRKAELRKLGFKRMLAYPSIGYEAKANRIVESVDETLGKVWILSRQLALLVKVFTQGKVDKTSNFGSYRVEIITLLFSRLVDIHNFKLVLDELDPAEMACVYCRIGVLNIFNPMVPDGYHMYNVGRSIEERMVVKILIGLSKWEPGFNWNDQQFRWSMDVPYVPGWELTQLWTTDVGMSLKGIISLNYVSSEGLLLNSRKALCNLVAVKERDFVNESEWFRNHPPLGTPHIAGMNAGDSALSANQDFFMKYLTTNSTFRGANPLAGVAGPVAAPVAPPAASPTPGKKKK